MARLLGRTTDNKPVYTFFYLHDTHGLPLDLIIERFQETGYMPAWTDYFDQAKEKGWNLERALLKLSVVVKNVYGEAWHKERLGYAEAYLKDKGYV